MNLKKFLDIFKPKLWKVVGSLGIGIFSAFFTKYLTLRPFSSFKFFYVLIVIYVLWSLLDKAEEP